MKKTTQQPQQGARQSRWDSTVSNAISVRFAASPELERYYNELWREYCNEGFADESLVQELSEANSRKFYQRSWEMALGRYLRQCGHRLVRYPEGQPDFRLDVRGMTVWVEAVSPEPGQDLPYSWTEPVAVAGNWAGFVPHKEMLLRWTAAFKQKAEKCLGYTEKGIIDTHDAIVIAVDCSQLSKVPLTHGISGLPIAVEFAFGVGSLALQVERDTATVTRSFLSREGEITNRNNASVRKDWLLQPQLSFVSAILACYHFGHGGSPLPVQIVHNPLADVKLEQGTFAPNADEWTATPIDGSSDGWSIKRLDGSSS